MPPVPSAKLNLTAVILIGLIVPILMALIDWWLLSREFGQRRDVAALQAMIGFVVQVGLFGVLCARFVEPSWLRWTIYGWCLLLTDLNASSSHFPEASRALFTAQLGLVTVWAILGTTRLLVRVVVMVLILPLLLSHVSQTAALCLICFALRSQRYYLALVEPKTDSQIPDPGKASWSPIQFGVGDLLLWITALAPLLAISRTQEGRMLTDGVLHAIVLVSALWATLGHGPAWLRWTLFSFVAFLAGLVLAQVDWFAWFGYRVPSGPRFFSLDHLEFLWHRQWGTVASYFLAGGMLAATLLIYRTLGYRLCRHKTVRRTMQYSGCETAPPVGRTPNVRNT